MLSLMAQAGAKNVVRAESIHYGEEDPELKAPCFIVMELGRTSLANMVVESSETDREPVFESLNGVASSEKSYVSTSEKRVPARRGTQIVAAPVSSEKSHNATVPDLISHSRGATQIIPAPVSPQSGKVVFTVPRLMDLLVDLSSALVQMKNASIVHMDVKPENILWGFGNQEIFKLADFGIGNDAERFAGEVRSENTPWKKYLMGIEPWSLGLKHQHGALEILFKQRIG
jgi:hypothetical protein